MCLRRARRGSWRVRAAETEVENTVEEDAVRTTTLAVPCEQQAALS